MLPHLNQTNEIQSEAKPFVGVIQTSDVLGSPDVKKGNVDVLFNGGRLQPGCYSNESFINECDILLLLLLLLFQHNFILTVKYYIFFKVGKAIKCSFDLGIRLFENSMSSYYKARFFHLCSNLFDSDLSNIRGKSL